MSLATFALLLLTTGQMEAATNAKVASNLSSEGDAQAAPARPALHDHPTLLSMLQRNNELRQRMGLRPQRINPVLTMAAQNHAWFMARTGSFSHYSNRGPWGRARRFGFGGNVRENIAMGQGNVLSAFHSWRNSGGHWASIISDAPEVGFGYARSKNGSPYWVAVYGYPTAEDKQQVSVQTAELKTETTAAPPTVVEATKQPTKEATATADASKAAASSRTTSSNNNYRRRGILQRWFR